MKKKKVLFISSTGGHLDELMQLKTLFEDYNYHIITEKTKSNISLNNKFPGKVSFLVYGTKDKLLIYPFKYFHSSSICVSCSSFTLSISLISIFLPSFHLHICASVFCYLLIFSSTIFSKLL